MDLFFRKSVPKTVLGMIALVDYFFCLYLNLINLFFYVFKNRPTFSHALFCFGLYNFFWNVGCILVWCTNF